MAEYDSDSSRADDVETGVTLGYASKEASGDDFSQLGGHPSWLDGPPSGDLAKCKVCSGLLNALFQLNGDLPERHPGHERRLYLLGCKRKACRRKDGSVRGLRYSKVDATAVAKASQKPVKQATKQEASTDATIPASTIGNMLFGVNSPAKTATSNPFGGSTGAFSLANPFGASKASNPFATSTTSTQPGGSSDLSQTFAEKARIGVESTAKPTTQGPAEPWPETSSFPQPYPSYFVDADKEFLDPEPTVVPQQTRVEEVETESGNGSTSDENAAYESTMDKTFQKFADRVGQNPEQVLRYEYGGQPLLYSKKDAVGKAWPRVPRCSCGGQRQFELQLTPHAITELEAEDDTFEGMDWGTIILAVCGNDCEGWHEEWVGVQWEELAKAA